MQPSRKNIVIFQNWEGLEDEKKYPETMLDRIKTKVIPTKDPFLEEFDIPSICSSLGYNCLLLLCTH